MQLPLSLFDRTFSRPRSLLALAIFGISLLAFPFIFVALDHSQAEIFRLGLWRNLLVQPVVILYVVIVAPYLTRMGNEVVVSFRPLIDLDDESYATMVRDASQIPLRHELLAIGIGVLFGLQSASWSLQDGRLTWISVYWILASCAVYGLLCWSIYGAFASTRLTLALHRQLKNIDLFELTPYQVMGRHSLFLALVFVGGTVLSLIFGTQAQSLQSIEFWIVYLVLGLVPVLVFFVNMQPTHRVLAREKKRRLDRLQARIHQLIQELEISQDGADVSEQFASQFNALVAYEQRLQNARTWPYNTAQLRTVFFSILLPVFTALGKFVVENFWR
jgi:hypothetical protein